MHGVSYSIHDKSFLVNNFADFLDVRVKKTRFCPVIGDVRITDISAINIERLINAFYSREELGISTKLN